MSQSESFSDDVFNTSLPKSSFLLVGNGPYQNRGCEAIVRGTMEILSSAWNGGIRVQAGVMASPETVAQQQAAEIDARIDNFPISQVGKRLSIKWFMSQINKRLGTKFWHHAWDLGEHHSKARAALQIGGDNYSMDYGNIMEHVAIDRYLKKKGVPVFIWGASVGPFDSDRNLEKLMISHLKSIDGIFVRETYSRDYLEKNGVSENVYLVADPAFVMKESIPQDRAVRELVSVPNIGINISPLVARFADAGGALDSWREKAAEMIVACGLRSGMPILLIPHVGASTAESDDYSFMESLRQKVSQRISAPVKIAPALGAAELKWIIARCAAFAGARTHATIAALSSEVPTLSLSYSVKARGINQDVFGHQEFCQPVNTIEPSQFAEIMARLLDDRQVIREQLASRLPELRERANAAGGILQSRLSALY